MDLPDWEQDLPKLPDLKRFQRTFQGPQGKAQGMFGALAKWSKYNPNTLWKGNTNANSKKKASKKGPGKKTGF